MGIVLYLLSKGWVQYIVKILFGIMLFTLLLVFVVDKATIKEEDLIRSKNTLYVTEINLETYELALEISEKAKEEFDISTSTAGYYTNPYSGKKYPIVASISGITPEQLSRVLTKTNLFNNEKITAFAGKENYPLENRLLKLEKDTNVNILVVLAISRQESSGGNTGKARLETAYNIWGWGHQDKLSTAAAYSFPSLEGGATEDKLVAAFEKYMHELKDVYLTKGGKQYNGAGTGSLTYDFKDYWTPSIGKNTFSFEKTEGWTKVDNGEKVEPTPNPDLLAVSVIGISKSYNKLYWRQGVSSSYESLKEIAEGKK